MGLLDEYFSRLDRPELLNRPIGLLDGARPPPQATPGQPAPFALVPTAAGDWRDREAQDNIAALWARRTTPPLSSAGPIASSAATLQDEPWARAGRRLLGKQPGEERVQLWPERYGRAAASALNTGVNAAIDIAEQIPDAVIGGVSELSHLDYRRPKTLGPVARSIVEPIVDSTNAVAMDEANRGNPDYQPRAAVPTIKLAAMFAGGSAFGVPARTGEAILQRFPLEWDHLVIPFERETP